MESEDLEVWATHIDTEANLCINMPTEIALAIARALDASDAFANIRVVVRRQEELEW